MSQANWQIQAKNTAVSDRPRNDSGRQNKRRNWQLRIDIEPADATRLKQFMKQELHYYNTLYNSLAPRARTRPETLSGITEKHEQVFLAIAETGFKNIGREARKKDPVLPEELMKYKDFITGKNDAGVPNISDREDILFECAAEPASILPQIRRRMAKEFLEFYKTQAKLYMQKVPSHLAEEQAFRTAPETLEPLDDIRKRHLQIPRDCIRMAWNDQKEETVIKIPYMGHPIIIENLNLKEMDGWNYIIIHQEPGRIPIPSTPWLLEIRSIQNRYMLKYLDVRNPNAGTAFNVGKSGARKK